MPTQKKIDTVEELRERIERSSIAIAADYRGLTVTELGQLRRAIREAGGEMRVVNNHLFLPPPPPAGCPACPPSKPCPACRRSRSCSDAGRGRGRGRWRVSPGCWATCWPTRPA